MSNCKVRVECVSIGHLSVGVSGCVSGVCMCGMCMGIDLVCNSVCISVNVKV